MVIQVREKTIEEIEGRLAEMDTTLNKINYLESVLKATSFSFEIKRFLWKALSGLYEERGMFEKSAKAMANKARIEISFNDRIDSYITAAELFARLGKVDDADDMFVRAGRDTNAEQKMKVKLARKNVYLISAHELERKGKRAHAAKFYERLIKMDLEEVEKSEIKQKLLLTYKALGLFREAKLLEGFG